MAATHQRARGRRADAQRSIAAILDAAQACLTRDPDASTSQIASTAGVGRVTLYGHFPSRADLVDAVFAHTLNDAGETLDALDLTGDPREALDRLVTSSWQIVYQFRALLQAAQRTLGPERIREHHERPLRRVQALLARGQREGAFRTDLPVSWLAATFYSVMHGAADEIAAGRLAEQDTSRMISATLLAAFTPPGRSVPVASADLELE